MSGKIFANITATDGPPVWPWQAGKAGYGPRIAKILILAALPEEADALFPQNAGTRQERGGFASRHLDAGGHAIEIVTTGLGKVNAALAAGLFGAEADCWLMTGTCGALDAKPGAYWIAEAVQHDYGAARADGFSRYRAGDWPMGEAAELGFAAMAHGRADLPHARIASGDCFLADPVAASAMCAALRVQLVDMEVAAIAQAASRMGKPWGAIKAVTDDANGGSGGDFHANLAHAATLAAQATEAFIASL